MGTQRLPLSALDLLGRVPGNAITRVRRQLLDSDVRVLYVWRNVTSMPRYPGQCAIELRFAAAAAVVFEWLSDDTHVDTLRVVEVYEDSNITKIPVVST
jgi:hypothetical protein